VERSLVGVASAAAVEAAKAMAVVASHPSASAWSVLRKPPRRESPIRRSRKPADRASDPWHPSTIRYNSLQQVFCRRAVAEALEGKPPLHLAFAVPDHPWVDAHSAAAVRIAMTVAALDASQGVPQRATREARGADGVPDCAGWTRPR
jgi:hypothetical protein